MIIFENKGELDIRALKTLGVNVKQGNAIGYFGTGLKYAMSVLIRTGHEMIVCIGDMTYNVGSSPETIRSSNFNIMKINDELLGFCDDLGKNWTVRNAFRELACNCTDEDGSYYYVSDDDVEGIPTPTQGKTIIIVKGEGIEEAFDNKDEIFFSADSDTHFGDIVECRPEPSECIYYRGVNVYPEYTQLTYNILSQITLTEDRTAYHHFQLRDAVASYILNEAPKEIIEVVISANGGFEHDLDYEGEPSQDFLDVAIERYKTKQFLNANTKFFLQANGYVKKTKELSSASAGEEEFLRNAINTASKIIDIDKDIEVLVVIEDEDDGLTSTLSMVEFADDGILYVSREIFNESCIATAIIKAYFFDVECYLPCTHRYEDMLIDKLVDLA